MNVQILTKHPDEDRHYNFDFSLHPEIAGGQEIATVVSVSYVALQGGNEDLTVGDGLVAGDNVQVKIAGGQAGAEYLFTCLVKTSEGADIAGVGKLQVEDGR